jgi:hypothetical protein
MPQSFRGMASKMPDYINEPNIVPVNIELSIFEQSAEAYKSQEQTHSRGCVVLDHRRARTPSGRHQQKSKTNPLRLLALTVRNAKTNPLGAAGERSKKPNKAI